MTVRKYFGLKKETRCSCGCSQIMPAREDIAVMVDRDSYPAKRYIPGHEPGARTPSRPQTVPQNAPVPSPAAPTPKATPPAPSPPSPAEAEPRNSVSVVKSADEKPWAMIQVTINTGSFESVKVGIADYGEGTEKVDQLASRVARTVFEQVETQAIKELHARLDRQPGFGGGKTPPAPTYSPAGAGTPPINSQV